MNFERVTEEQSNLVLGYSKKDWIVWDVQDRDRKDRSRTNYGRLGSRTERKTKEEGIQEQYNKEDGPSQGRHRSVGIRGRL